MSQDQPMARTEANEADTAEQEFTVLEEDEPLPAGPLRDDVDPADATEQHRTVPLDDDDYR